VGPHRRAGTWRKSTISRRAVRPYYQPMHSRFYAVREVLAARCSVAVLLLKGPPGEGLPANYTADDLLHGATGPPGQKGEKVKQPVMLTRP